MSWFALAVALLVFIPPASGISKKIPEIEKTIVHASDLIRKNAFRESETAFRAILEQAIQRGDDYYAARARVGLSACYVSMHQFQAAIDNGQTALRYGLANKDADIVVRAALNLTSIYRRTGAFAFASQTLNEASPYFGQITNPSLKIQIYIQLATEAARRRDWKRAEPFFYASIDTALAEGEIHSAAAGWSMLGYMRLMSNDLPAAEHALIEAFRLRRSTGNRNLGSSYTYLGMLRMAQGDAQSALNLLNRAVEYGWNGEAAARLVHVYYWRAKAKQRLADVPGALKDFEAAVERANQWRQETLPTDDYRLPFEVGLDKIYDDFVSAGMEVWQNTRDTTQVRKMFEIAEQHKSASFRRILTAGKQMPPEYWSALEEYRNALLSNWRVGKAEVTDDAKLKLSRVEATLGLKEAIEGRGTIAEVQQSLSKDEALISFFTGESKSWVWAITRNTVDAYPIPGRREFAPTANLYRSNITDGKDPGSASTRLHDMLFGQLNANVQAKPDWLLSLDDGLYDVPFAALGPEKSPLIVSHSLRTIFGAGLLGRNIQPVGSSEFIGAGDAIYNSADSRWQGPRPKNTTEFARLVNTGPEVAATSKAWSFDTNPTLLLGREFNRDALSKAFQSEFAVVHIAAHVVRHSTEAKEVMIGIGLRGDGTPDFLTPSDIAVRSLRVGLVTMNGCASGTGAQLPGAGLIGLTRSWLVAGATAVAATYWPVEDERGELFVHMYRDIAAQGKPAITASKAARALRSAQLEAWRGGGDRSKPRSWAAVFLSTKS